MGGEGKKREGRGGETGGKVNGRNGKVRDGEDREGKSSFGAKSKTRGLPPSPRRPLVDEERTRSVW